MASPGPQRFSPASHVDMMGLLRALHTLPRKSAGHLDVYATVRIAPTYVPLRRKHEVHSRRDVWSNMMSMRQKLAVTGAILVHRGGAADIGGGALNDEDALSKVLDSSRSSMWPPWMRIRCKSLVPPSTTV